MTTLVLKSDNAIKYSSFCQTSKAKIIINESYVDEVFKSIYSTIISNI